MGSLRISQDGITVEVTWPYGAIELGQAGPMMKAAERLWKLAAKPLSIGTLMASSMTYDGTEPPSGHTDFSRPAAPEGTGPTGPGSTEPPIAPRSEP
jgi:hypothetical protein